MKPIGLQLYSLREMAAKDFIGVLEKVADIGYKGVEFAGLHGHDPKEIKKIIDSLGLKVTSSHCALPTKENAQEVIDTESILGNTKLISGFGPQDFATADDVKRAAEKFAVAGDLVKPHGMKFGFHNHWWEFAQIDGKYVYDMLMEGAPNVFSELDVYWTAYGKADTVEIVKKHSARLPLLHIKDGPLVEGKPHTAVGKGAMDMHAIIGAADPNVLEWLIVELDDCATDMLDAVVDSYKYLVSEKLAEGNK